ncbi:MAG: hypothetical protein EBR09_05385 [Proteobacteria bacterium]|nr:hypothetical protein [Pseudomonadota bacterium]
MTKLLFEANHRQTILKRRTSTIRSLHCPQQSECQQKSGSAENRHCCKKRIFFIKPIKVDSGLAE